MGLHGFLGDRSDDDVIDDFRELAVPTFWLLASVDPVDRLWISIGNEMPKIITPLVHASIEVTQKNKGAPLFQTSVDP